MQGPVRPDVNEQRFRQTGESQRIRSVDTSRSSAPVQGPVRSGSSEERFRATGDSQVIQSVDPNAQRTSSTRQNPQVLKSVTGRVVQYGYDGSSRNLDRERTVLPSGQRDTSSLSGFGRLVAAAKKSFQQSKEQKQTYVSALGPTGAFVSASEDTGGRGTVIARVPNTSELKDIEEAQAKGDLFDRSATEIVSQAKVYNDLVKGFDKLSVDQQQAKLVELRQVGADVDPLTNEIIPPTVMIGFGLNKKEIPLDELDTRNPRTVLKSGIAYLAAAGAERRARNLGLGDGGLFTIPGASVDTPTLPYLARGTESGPRGSSSVFQRIDNPDLNVLTPSQVGTATRLGVEVGPYFVPGAGQTLFLSEAAYDVGYEARQGTSPLAFARKYPVETLALGTLGLVKVGRASRAAVTPELKVVRATQDIPSIQPNIFLQPISARAITTPDGNKVTELFYKLSGRARQGAQISTVELQQTRPILDFFGFKPRTIYSSLEKGSSGRLILPTGVVRLTKSYNNALSLLSTQLQKTEGLTPAQSVRRAKSLLRQFSKSPTDVTISGQGKVTYGLSENPQVQLFSDVRYEPKVVDIGKGKLSRKFQPFKQRIRQEGEALGDRKGVELYKSFSDSVKSFFAPGNPAQEFSKLTQAGRTTISSVQASGARSLGNVRIGNKQFELFEEASLSRQVNPVKRSPQAGRSRIFVNEPRGGVPTVDFGQPIKNVPRVEAFKPNPNVQLDEAGAQRLIKTLKDIYGTASKDIASLTPKINTGFGRGTPKSGTINLKAPTPTPRTSLLTGGLQRVSAFEGKGTYETMSVVESPTVNLRAINVPSLGDASFSSVSSKVNSFQPQPTKDRLSFGFGASERSEQPQRISPSFGSGSKSESRVRQDSASANREATRTGERFRESTRLRVNTGNPPRMRPPRLPAPVFVPKPRSEKSAKKKLVDIAVDIIEEFEVFTRKGGKDVRIGEFSDLRRAKQALRSELGNTLRASGFVSRKSTGEKVRLNFGAGFRPSKSDSFRIVQERGTRLGSFGERREIRGARRSAGKSRRGRKVSWFS